MSRQEIQGSLVGTGKRFAIVAGRWNEFFCDAMIKGAIEELARHGVSRDDISVFRCPGCFELPAAAQRVARKQSFDGIICLGVLIRGATPHFDYICSTTASGVARVALDEQLPVSFGVITVDNLDQAIERSGSKAGNKGVEAALATLEMVSLYEKIDAGES